MKYLVLGGGIAGVCCAEELCKLCPRDSVSLISSDDTLKGVGNVVKHSDNLEQFEIIQRDLASLPYANLSVIQGYASTLQTDSKELVLTDGQVVMYDKVCICTGATPKAVADSPHVLVLRDQDSIEALAQRLPGVRRAVLVGNGGIALEVAHAFSGLEVVWAVRHGHIGDAFFDLDAAAFLCSQLQNASPVPQHHAPKPDSSSQSAPRAQSQQSQPDHQENLGTSYAGCNSYGHDHLPNAAQRNPAQHSQQPSLAQHSEQLASAQLDSCSRPGTYLQTSPQKTSDSRGDFPVDAAQQLPGVQVSSKTEMSSADTETHAQGNNTQADCPSQQSQQSQVNKRVPQVPGMQQLPQRRGVRRHDRHSQHSRELDAQGRDAKSQQAGQGPQGQAAQDQPQQAGWSPQGEDCHRRDAENQPQQTDPNHKAAHTQPEVAEAHQKAAGVQQSSIKTSKGSIGHRFGHALGPLWAALLPKAATASQIHLEYGTEVTSVQPNTGSSEQGWPVTVHLSNGRSWGADIVISAIGVKPNVTWLPAAVHRDEEEGGVLVDRMMQSSVPGVYAAGDACSIAWTDKSPHWFQMRLWGQARIQGMFAAHAMAGVTDEMASGFNFELFTHNTRFCGRKVVLLGLYNGQGLEDEPAEDMVTYTRSAEGVNATFVRVLLLRGRMQGAVLIGETELEETFEHLILDGLDLSRYGPALLAPDVELEMVFD